MVIWCAQNAQNGSSFTWHLVSLVIQELYIVLSSAGMCGQKLQWGWMVTHCFSKHFLCRHDLKTIQKHKTE